VSGIAGIVRFDGAPVAAGLVETMTAAMAHRGPDGISHWLGGAAALGQCMLATTAESLEERQPLANEDASLVLVMDGRVDNWEELRRALLAEGTALRNRSDAELVLRAYEAWGRDCLRHIDGDFALAVWDTRQRAVFCARDRMGNKPFHYHWDGNTFAFASELRALLALPWVRPIPNEGMLAEYLAAEMYARDETVWSGILRLVAAHRMTAGAKGPRPECYWEPDLWAPPPFRRDEDYIDHYRELLADSVRRASRSHRPVAVEVSGGLDSSAVFCMAEHLRRRSELPAPGIQGYTLAFTDADGEAGELAYARAVGEYLGLPIHEIPPSRPPLPWFAERARVERDFPGFPNATMGLGLWRQAAAQGVRVALSGIGGDQWLQGSRLYYAEALALRQWGTLHDCLKTDAAAFGTRRAAGWLVRHGLFPLLPLASQARLRRLVQRLRGRETPTACYWLSPPMREMIGQRRARVLPPSRRPVCRAGQRELLESLDDAFSAQAMEGVERLCAHAGIEMRYPLQDPRLVQYAFSTPERLRLRGGRTKYLHVRALQDLMPRVILERRDKAIFSIVFREHLDAMQEALTGLLSTKRAAWLDPDGMARLFRAYLDYPQAGWPLWILWGVFGCDTIY